MTTHTEFNLPPHARVWIYQSSRFFTPAEVQEISRMAAEFVGGWNTHGKELSAGIQVLHNLFVVIAVDEMKAAASGCSIDQSVRLIKEIEKTYGISLTGRTTLAYFDDSNAIQLKHFNDVKDALEKGVLPASTLVFNNLISTLADLEKGWLIPAGESWLYKIPT